MKIRGLLVTASALASVVGCVDGAELVDAGGGVGDVVDAGLDDAGFDADAGIDVDAGFDIDAGFDVDAGFAVDAGFDVDAGFAVDAGVETIEPPDPLLVGGPLTVSSTTAPFLTPADGLPPAVRSRFSMGRELFVADWNPAGLGQGLVDGLGPLFHATSCIACHPGDRRATSHLPNGSVDLGLLIRLGHVVDGGWDTDPDLGAQLQPRSLSGLGEGRVTTTTRATSADFSTVAQTSPALTFVLSQLSLPLAATTAPGGRLSPQIVGSGLLDRISDDDLLARADPDDDDGDGISGRAHILADGRIGRFGWKALASSTLTQTEAAFANDLGISTPTRAIDCTPAQSDCLQAAHGGDPEIEAASLEHVVTFMTWLGVPAARRTPGDAVVARGAAVFDGIGCTACHVETWTTSSTPTTPADALLAGVVFHPYTDLLLHDLGDELADIGEGDASPNEWRTTPLWGIGLVEAASSLSSRFLHDGRATSIADAIAWHGGEAAAARDAWRALDDDDRAALLTFLRSL